MTEPTTATVTAKLTATRGAQFEIIIITAGQAEGHPWYFPAEVLRLAAPLFNEIPSYIDHEGTPDKKRHSAQDLGGLIHSPTWSDEYQGIQALLNPTGPGADALRALAQAALDFPHLNIGFSADIDLTSDDGQTVREIVRVRSADAVLSPARGGQFLRALLSKGELPMSDQETTQGVTQPAPDPDVEKTRAAMQSLLDTQAEQQKAAEQRKAMEKTHVQMCGYLLESGLNASGLPAPVASRIRAQFQGKAFEAPELETAIKDARVMLSELQGESTVQGFGRVNGMFSALDQIQAAVDDLFLVKRDEGKEKLQVARLTGIRELYLGLTGDYDFAGGVNLHRAQFQSTTATFPGLVKNAMNKAIAEAWAQYGAAGYDWWTKIATVEPFETLNDVTWLRVGTIASLPIVAEGADYTELTLGDNAETGSFIKYGGFLGITLEALDRDNLRQLRMAPREMAKAAIRNISSLVAAIFTEASATGPLLADGGRLFNSTAVTTAGGHANLLTTALGGNYIAWNAVASAVYNQPMLIGQTTYGGGAKQALDPRYCLVPKALQSQAEALFIPRWEAIAQNVAAVSPTWGGKVEPVVVPEWTDTTDWAAAVDPALLPGVMIGTRFGLQPSIILAGNEGDPAMFTNDESRLKVRHFLTVGIADWRALHKSNVAE